MAEEKSSALGSFLMFIIIIVIIILVVLLFLFYFIDVEIAGTTPRDRYYTIKERYEPFFYKIKDLMNSVYKNLKNLDEILGGEKSFSLEEEIEYKEMTGISIGEIKPWLGGRKVSVDVEVWKLERDVTALVSCSLHPRGAEPIAADKISSSYGEDGKLIIPSGKRNFHVDCIFPIEIENSDKIKFGLIYSSSSEAELDVFVVPESVFDYYYGSSEKNFDDVFKDKQEGIYGDDYTSIVPSKLEYSSDVWATMNFEIQPLSLNRKNNLLFEFKREDKEGEVNFRGFDVELPDGIRFWDCDYFDDVGRIAILKEEYYKEINDDLNSDKKSRMFGCSVSVGNREEVMGGAGGELMRIEPSPAINGTVQYDYILEKEKRIRVVDIV